MKSNKRIKIITDLFCQCELCKKWLRLYDEDGNGWRTIPLFNRTIMTTDNQLWGELWICEECWDKKEEEEEDKK